MILTNIIGNFQFSQISSVRGVYGISTPVENLIIYISSPSCRAASTDIYDPLLPLLPIVHRLWQVFRATSRILTELLYVCSSWSSCFCVVHRSTSLMSSSLLLQQCPACLFRLTWIVFQMGGRWPYSWCLVGCCRQDLSNIARNILV